MIFHHLSTILTIITLHATTIKSMERIHETKWKAFISTHNKIYSNTTEEAYRQEIFLKNLETINDHNKLYMQGVETYKMGVNQYADITGEEFRDLLLNVNAINARPTRDYKYRTRMLPSSLYEDATENSIPEDIDWRKRNAVTPVKNQGTCGSCWAFSAAASLESAYYIKTGRYMTLSEQNLLDCTSPLTGGDNTCKGGSVEAALDYTIHHGLACAARYPYTGVKRRCRYNATENVLPIVQGYITLPSGDEHHLKLALALKGPTSVSIDATYIQFYSEGIFNDPRCKNEAASLTHALLAVGYGKNRGLEYWILKNSWGERWGEEGYIRLKRNSGNMCGVATQAIYPVIKEAIKLYNV